MSVEKWSDLLFSEAGPRDGHAYGSVRAVNEDGSYMVQLNASNTLTRCAPFCTAMVGDRVKVVINANGKCDAIGRLGGDLGGGGGGSSAITVQCSEEFSGGNAVGYVNLGKETAKIGNDFAVNAGAVVCKFTGYVIVSTTCYIRTSSTNATPTFQVYLHKNGEHVTTAATSDTPAGQLSISPFLVKVSAGDRLQMMARSWANADAFTLKADNMTNMTVKRVSAGGGGGTGTIEPTVAERLEMLESEAVVASGTSGIWEYIKFANGMAVLSTYFVETSPHYSTYNNMYAYYTATKAFPFAFVENPGVGYGAYIGSGFAINARVVVTTTDVSFFYLASASGSQDIKTHAVVMGRWK